MVLPLTSKRKRCDHCRPIYERKEALASYYRNADEINARLRARHAERVANKLCDRCGIKLNEFYTLCKRCRKDAYKRARKSWKTRKIKQIEAAKIRVERARFRTEIDFDRRWDRLFKPDAYDVY